MFRRSIKSSLPDRITELLSRLNVIQPVRPRVHHIHWGDFNNVLPFSERFGYDRGGPVDRYYIERFLLEHSAQIRGEVLEIADNTYTLRFGKERVLNSEVLNYNQSGSKATYTGDLSKRKTLPVKKFDCFIVTQTLQYIYDFKAAILNAYDLLKPGGTLLITAPGISPIDQGELHEEWLWSFNRSAFSKLFADLFGPDADYVIGAYGNVRSAAAFLYGVGLPELDPQVLDFRDRAFDVVVTAKITRPANE